MPAPPNPSARSRASALRLRLVSGKSPLTDLYFVPGSPQRSLDVGRSPDCAWQVTAEGVEPMHVELRWDGEALWVRDPHRAGDVAIDGDRVSTWRRVLPGKRLVFGLAMMVADDVDAHEDAGVPTLVVGGEMDDYADTTLPNQKARSPSGAPLEGDATIADLAMPPDPDAQTFVRNPMASITDESTETWMQGAAARDAHAALYPQPPPDTPRAPVGRSRAGNVATELRPRLGEARADAIVSAPATQLVVAPSDLPPAETLVARPVPQAPLDRETLPPSQRPPAARRPELARAGAVDTPSGARATHAAGDAPSDPRTEATDVSARAEPSKRIGKLQTTLPVRTWGLLIVTVLAAVVVLMMDSGGADEEDAAVVRRDQSAGGAPRAVRQPSGEGASAETASPAPVTPAPVTPTPSAEDEALARQGEPEPTSEAGRTAEPAFDDEAAAIEEGAAIEEDPAAARIARAADLLIARRYREALPLYEELEREHPDVEEYRLVVRILRAQLGAGTATREGD